MDKTNAFKRGDAESAKLRKVNFFVLPPRSLRLCVEKTAFLYHETETGRKSLPFCVFCVFRGENIPLRRGRTKRDFLITNFANLRRWEKKEFIRVSRIILPLIILPLLSLVVARGSADQEEHGLNHGIHERHETGWEPLSFCGIGVLRGKNIPLKNGTMKEDFLTANFVDCTNREKREGEWALNKRAISRALCASAWGLQSVEPFAGEVFLVEAQRCKRENTTVPSVSPCLREKKDFNCKLCRFTQREGRKRVFWL